MTDNLKTAFGSIHAEDELKSKTLSFLQNEIMKRSASKKKEAFRKFSVAIASVAVLFLSGVFSYNLYFTPIAYVDLDVNPSLELTLNRFNRVIESSPYNDDGAVILLNVNVRHKTYDEAIQALLDEMIKQGHLAQDGLVSVTVQTNDNAVEQRLLESLQTTVSTHLTSHHSAAATDLFAISDDVRHHAQDHNVSPAMYLVITELQSVDPSATFEGCMNKSISQIRQLTQGHHGEPLEDTDTESNQNGNVGDEGMMNEQSSPPGHHHRRGGGHR